MRQLRGLRRAPLICSLLLMLGAALMPATVATATPYSQAVLGDSPLGYWRLDGSSLTSATDTSGNGYTLTGPGTGLTAGVTGPMVGSTAMAFSGGYLGRAYFAYTNNFAIEFWVRSNRVNERQAPVSNGWVGTDNCWHGVWAGVQASLLFGYNANTCNLGGSTTNFSLFSSQSDWHHVVVQRSAGVTSLWTDGVQHSTTNSITVTLNGGSFRIGGLQNGSASQSFGPFSGALSEVAYYNHVLTGAQIAAHYNAAVGAPTNTTPPAIAPETFLGPGLMVSASTGKWVGAGMTYAYQWRRCDGSGANCSDITGETASTYTPQGDDAGHMLRVQVTATDSEGTATESSAATEVVAAQTPHAHPLYSQVVLGDSPLGYWSLDGLSLTSTADASGNGYTLTGPGTGLTANVTGPMAGAKGMAFSGGYLGRSYFAYSNNFAIEFWVRSNRVNERQAPVSNGWVGTDNCWHGVWAGAQASILFGYNANTCSLGGSTTNFSLFSGQADWHHVVVQRAAGVTSLWTDGVQKPGTNSTTVTLNGGSFRIGGLHNGSASQSFGPFSGAISDVAYYNHVLTGTQIAAHYNAAVGIPTSATSPTITPTTGLHESDVVTADHGTWAGAGTITYGYQWQACTSPSSCAPISGATATTYQLTAAEVGKTIKVVVTATSALGLGSATSAATAEVAETVPSNTTAPSISGEATEDENLTSTTGTWSGGEPISYSRQWRRCDASGAACADISGATGNSYTLASADVGATIRAKVTATNTGGSASASSAPTDVIAGAATSLLSALSMDDDDGSTIDDSVAGADARTVTGTEWTGKGRYGGGRVFDGQDDYITLDDVHSIDAGSSLTFEAWVKPRTLDGGESLMSKHGDGWEDWGVWANGADIDACIGGCATVTGVLHVGRWTHVAVTRADGVVRLYVDGRQVAQDAGDDPGSSAPGPILVGGDAWSSLDGVMDEVRLYSDARTAQEIHEDMLTRVDEDGGPQPALTLAMAFDRSGSDFSADLSGRNAPVSLTGALQAGVGRLGRGASLDGQEGFAVPGATLGVSGDFSFAAWVRMRSDRDQQPVLDLRDAAGRGFLLDLADPATGRPTLTVTGAGGTDEVSAAEAAPTLSWFRVAVIRHDDSVALYLGDTLVGTVPAPTGVGALDILRVGGDGAGHGLDGILDEIRVYPTAISAGRLEDDALEPIDPGVDAQPRLLTGIGFEEGAGSLAANAGELADDVSVLTEWTEAGRFGRGVQFDGSTSRVWLDAVSNLRLHDGLTVEAWVRLEAGSDGPAVNQSAGSAGFALSAGTDTTGASARLGSVTVTADQPLPVDRWSHLAMTWDGALLRLFVDGAAVEQAAVAQSPGGSAPLRIGYDAGGERLRGAIDEVRVYDGPLDDAAIEADRDAPVPESGQLLPSGGAATGEADDYTFESYPLGDSGTAKVNVANGNLMFQGAQGPSLGIGNGLELVPVLNSMRMDDGDAGRGGGFAIGGDVRLGRLPDGRRVLRGPGGIVATFPEGGGVAADQEWDGGANPSPVAARLTVDDTSEEVSFTRTGIKLVFARAATVNSINSARGSRLQTLESGDASWDLDYDDTGLHALQNDLGDTVTLTTSNGRVTGAESPGDQQFTYTYSGGELVSISSDGEILTSLTWSAHRLLSVEDHEGAEVTVDYDAQGRVETVHHRVTTSGSEETIDFAYGVDETAITEGGATHTLTLQPGSLRVIGPDATAPKVTINGIVADIGSPDDRWDDEGSPAVVYTDGELDPGDDYGPGSYSNMDVTVSDDVSGVKGVYWGNQSTPYYSTECVYQPDRSCPREFKPGVAVHDTDDGDDFQISAVDGAGNRSAAITVRVFSDRTAPGTPSDIELTDFDPLQDTAVVSWTPGEDPNIVPRWGQIQEYPGSGSTASEYRYRIDEGPWSNWVQSTTTTADITGVGQASTVQVEVKSVDAVGNVGLSAGESLLLWETEEGVPTTEPASGTLPEDESAIGTTGSNTVTAQVRAAMPSGTPDQPAMFTPITLIGPIGDDDAEALRKRTSISGEVSFEGLAAGEYSLQTWWGETKSITVSPTATTAEFITQPTQAFEQAWDANAPVVKWCGGSFLHSSRLSICSMAATTGGAAMTVAFNAYAPRPPSTPTAPGRTPDAGPGNAFQHALWNTLLVEVLDRLPGADNELFGDALDFTARVFETKGMQGSLSQRQSSRMDKHNDVFGSYFARHRLSKYGGREFDPDHRGRRAIGLCRELFRRARAQRHVTFPPKKDTWRQKTPSSILVHIVRRTPVMGEMIPIVQERGGERHCDEYADGRPSQDGNES
jgi:YD repeat-containing protein